MRLPRDALQLPESGAAIPAPMRSSACCRPAFEYPANVFLECTAAGRLSALRALQVLLADALQMVV